ncbi:MAG: cation diffusion facilitator family transporter [Elusimicrobiota bacterium]
MSKNILKSDSDRKKYGYIEGWVSIIVNVTLFGLKLWAGMISNSVAIMADAWHTIADSVTSLLVIAGFKISGKSADSEHPFGHGRMESVISIIIATLLGTVSFNFLKESIIKLHSRETAVFGTAAMVIIGVSVVVKELNAQLAFWLDKKIDSSAIRADGWHHRTDAITSAVIIISILLGGDIWWLDGLLGIIISLVLFHAVYEILKDTVYNILGRQVSRELKDRVFNLIKDEIPESKYAHHFHIHQYGEHRELTFHLCFEGNMNLKEAHDKVSRAEKLIRDRLSIEATVHIEPASVIPEDEKVD